VRRGVACIALALLLVGCAAPPPPAEPVPAQASVEELATSIQASAARSEHDPDPGTREQLSAQASRDAAACLARAPHAVACLYGQAIALGLEARTHPTRASDLLTRMLAALSEAETVDPVYDNAGPARVRALVLIRAPSWPLGPGDDDAGLIAAQRAVELRPEYPPNLLALAEALDRTGNAVGAREAYTRARDAAQVMPMSPDRDDWVREADQALQRK
jgi:hypothetical protein